MTGGTPVIYIYALVDGSGGPRYVGQTSKKLSTRLSQHRSFAARHGRALDLWLRGCPEASVIPLEVDPSDPDEAERRWIRQMRSGGVSLLNLYDGGRRAPTGLKHTAESKARMSAAFLGKPLSSEHRAKLSEAHRGVPLSAEHRAAIGRGGKGRVMSAEARAHISAAKKGQLNPMSRSARERRAREIEG